MSLPALMSKWSILALLTGQALAGIRDCPSPPVPAQVVLQTVADEMQVNGRDMRIWRVKLNQLPAKFIDFYRGAWTGPDGKPLYVEYPLDAWSVIATNKGNCYYTVQVQAEGKSGSMALLGVGSSNKSPDLVSLGKDWPQMTGSKVINDLRSKDGGRTGRLLVIGNSYSSAGNALFYREQMTRAGWTLVQDRNPNPQKLDSHVMQWRRGSAWVDITIEQKNGSSLVVANINE